MRLLEKLGMMCPVRACSIGMAGIARRAVAEDVQALPMALICDEIHVLQAVVAASDHVLLAKRSSQRESWGANSVETSAMANTENTANTA